MRRAPCASACVACVFARADVERTRSSPRAALDRRRLHLGRLHAPACVCCRVRYGQATLNTYASRACVLRLCHPAAPAPPAAAAQPPPRICAPSDLCTRIWH